MKYGKLCSARVLAIALGCMWVAAGSIEAGTYYVSDPNGLDTNPGTSEAPWKTFAKAAATISGGDTEIIRDGTYLASTFIFSPAGTGPGNRTVYRADTGHRPLLTRSDGKPPNVYTSDYLRVEGLWMGGKWTDPNDAGGGFYTGGSPVSNDKEIIGNTIFGYQGGISIGSSQYQLIQGNRIIDCGYGSYAHPIYLSGGYTVGQMAQHVVLDNNSLVGGEGYALHGWHSTSAK